MTLHPQPQKVRDRLAVEGGFAYESLTLEAYRQSVDALLSLAGKPQSVLSIEHYMIQGPNGEIRIDIYVPEKMDSDGAIIYFAGNGFVYGDLPQKEVESRALANACRCKIVNVISRSAPEWKFPVGLNDAYAGLEWVFIHADELKINQDKIGVCGDSSGGNFAAVCAIRARDNGLKLALQILISPVLDLSMSASSYDTYNNGYLLGKADVAWILDLYLPENADRHQPEISPFFQTNLAGLPPTLITNAEYEVLQDEGRIYADKLRQAEVEVTYSLYEGQIHSYVFFRGEFDQEDNPLDEVGLFVQEYFN